jgi:hypothetical protein
VSLTLTKNTFRGHAAAVGLTSLAAAGLALGVTGVSPASAADAPACPTGAFAFTSDLTNGAFVIGKQARSSGAVASACGSITGDGAGGLLSTVKKENVTFKPTTTKVLFLDLPTTVTPTSDLTGPVVLGANGIEVTLKGSVTVTTEILGQKCSFPLNLSLTTGKSGALTGTPLTADAATGRQAGKLVSGDFTVPKFKGTKTCNVIVAEFSNALLGLPLKSGASTATFDLSLKLGV